MRHPVAKVMVVAGEEGRLVVHLFSQGSGVRWWGCQGIVVCVTFVCGWYWVVWVLLGGVCSGGVG